MNRFLQGNRLVAWATLAVIVLYIAVCIDVNRRKDALDRQEPTTAQLIAAIQGYQDRQLALNRWWSDRRFERAERYEAMCAMPGFPILIDSDRYDFDRKWRDVPYTPSLPPWTDDSVWQPLNEDPLAEERDIARFQDLTGVTTTFAMLPKSRKVRGLKVKTKDGRILAFHIDSVMYVGEPYIATLIVAGNADSSTVLVALNRTLDAKISDTRSLRVYTDSFKIGDSMKASLLDPVRPPRFAVDTPNPSVQDITRLKNDLRIWQWHITPQQAGRNDLYLDVQVIQKGKLRKIDPSFKRSITVSIKTLTWISRSFAYLAGEGKWWLTAMLFPLITWLVTRWRQKKSNTGEENETPPADPVDI